MNQDPDLTIALLTRTPAALSALLRGLPGAWTSLNEGGNTMTVWDAVGHLIHAERRNWIPRLKIIMGPGEGEVFPAFDRWGYTRANAGRPMEQLLDEFEQLRRESLDDLRRFDLTHDDMARRGQHPALGVVTLSQLLAAWVGHDLTHVHQISRILAHQYREAVGPWNAYLGVLQCTGHSA